MKRENFTEEERNRILKEEDLNEDFIPIVGDVVEPLPYTSSNKLKWTCGVVTNVFSDSPAECWITTDGGKQIIEYCNSILPLLTAQP